MNKYVHDANGRGGRLRRMWGSGGECEVWTCAEGGDREGVEGFGEC